MDKVYSREEVRVLILKIEGIEEKILKELALLTELKKSLLHHSTLSDAEARHFMDMMISRIQKLKV